MDTFYNTINDWFAGVTSSTWQWFATLSREEWVIVLGVGAACGFLCMRGFGSRSNY